MTPGASEVQKTETGSGSSSTGSGSSQSTEAAKAAQTLVSTTSEWAGQNVQQVAQLIQQGSISKNGH